MRCVFILTHLVTLQEFTCEVQDVVNPSRNDKIVVVWVYVNKKPLTVNHYPSQKEIEGCKGNYDNGVPDYSMCHSHSCFPFQPLFLS